ncbi:DUF952 domain-containing protein [Bradyrhizobium brasilense]|uniref:DUF952 domain-containing protein n=1 Tax=Bradyrhizobium brasilense TaxID=1419277 RepID=UPI0024B130A5|nr:DUF952 domain-containing protein [Bradyrhizobium australafricanum]WFU29619.1 DUF952 domain-containing protein [Bradyrhizobium australafricanum]
MAAIDLLSIPTSTPRPRHHKATMEMNLQPSVIYHICSPAAWAAASNGEYRSASFDSEGFIHCSTPEQLVEVANYLFRGQRGLILLVIDPARVIPPIRYEDAGNGKLYPHIYGPLNASAVAAVQPFEPDADGTFDLQT